MPRRLVACVSIRPLPSSGLIVINTIRFRYHRRLCGVILIGCYRYRSFPLPLSAAFGKPLSAAVIGCFLTTAQNVAFCHRSRHRNHPPVTVIGRFPTASRCVVIGLSWAVIGASGLSSIGRFQCRPLSSSDSYRGVMTAGYGASTGRRRGGVSRPAEGSDGSAELVTT